MTFSAFICGLAGPQLSDREARLLAEARPCGVILFKRNCETPDQVRALTSAIRDAFGDSRYPILIDQEGGRVQRMGPPHWPARPAAALLGAAGVAGVEAAYWSARLIAQDLLAAGVNVNCAPVLDIPAPGAHGVIGDRAYGEMARHVAAFGRAVAQGYLDGGVLPVIKHIPGHGRAGADSHFDLPVVETPFDELTDTDFEPFRALAHMPLAMTAHVLFSAIDATAPASASPTLIAEVIRGHIGFDGLLMCDDVSMQALSGSIAERTRAVLAAGCDAALHCNGDFDEMLAVADAAGALSGAALDRYLAALARLQPPFPLDVKAAEARVAETLAGIA
ncbi:MAG: beta-N-acetylhexosaminidase [Hyphomicrobiales bacterium]|nr:beta-N-acetylhexosaminidase [Hyphomicrobiales bacterium]